MPNAVPNPFRRLVWRIDILHWHLRTRIPQLARAWRYATNRLSADDAQRMMWDCRHPAGWHPLLVLTVEDTLEHAREIFADHPDLPRLIADGCARVGDKWESYGDELYEARKWAIEVAEKYAADEGITLTRLDGEETDDKTKRATP